MKEYGLNDIIKVKLSETGIEVLNERYSQYGYYKQPDSEGYFEFQLWEFMNIYGKYMNIGNIDVLKESKIVLDDKYLTEHKRRSLSKER